jgi:hypothetical protein
LKIKTGQWVVDPKKYWVTRKSRYGGSVAQGTKKWEVLRRKEIVLHVQCTIIRLDTHTDVSVDTCMHEKGRILGKGMESYDILETTKLILDRHRERPPWIYARTDRRSDNSTISTHI